jgi:hypothetical protein
VCPNKCPQHFRFTEFGGTIRQRPVEDLAFAVARFVQKGGSFINYYMVWHEKKAVILLLRSFLTLWVWEILMIGGLLVFVDSIMEEQILGALLGVPSSQQAMIMMLQLMNMVSLLGEILFFW